MGTRRSAAVYRRRRVAAAASVLVLAAGAVVLVRGLADDAATGEPPSAASTTEPGRRPAAAPTTAVATSTTLVTGRFGTAPGGSARTGAGRLWRYRVEVEAGTGVDAADFAAAVDATLSDPRGWTTADGISVQRVSDDTADIVVTLATPPTTDLLCAPLTTEGQVSCAIDERAVINLTRWLEGAAPSKLALADYRDYVVTHEVGHLIGHHGHERCRGRGQLATTMMQQTLGIGDCRPNPWPEPLP